mmetsp:Transcript_71426/g.155136  ORF Transcript_71426/g.155136 Transcript_71426/m.155136 type:complete len:300 (-) Transcript_71426:147-1046(-)
MTPGAAQHVVRAARRVLNEAEEVLHQLGRQAFSHGSWLLISGLSHHHGREAVFADLSLVHFLIDGACGEEPVNVAMLLLAVTPNPGHGLAVVGRVPVGVKHDQTVGTNKVEAATTGLRREEEGEGLLVLWTVEVLHKLHAFADGHCTVEAVYSPLAVHAHLLNDVKRLRPIGNDDNAVSATRGLDSEEDLAEEHELSRELLSHRPLCRAKATVRRIHGLKQCAGPLVVKTGLDLLGGRSNEKRMIHEGLEFFNRAEDRAAHARLLRQQLLRDGRPQEGVVELALEARKRNKDVEHLLRG